MTQEFNIIGIYNYADLLENLQRGYRLCSVEEYRDGTKGLQTRVHADECYIYWNHYGSSANLATAREMEFVVTQIFQTTLEEFIRKFVWDFA